MAHPYRTRPPAVAGTFYPGSPVRLRETVDRLLAEAGGAARDSAAPRAAAMRTGTTAPAQARERAGAAIGPPAALLVPHAGYVYSGPVAACAYRTLIPYRERVRHVVLLGPAHRARLVGLALPDAEAFETPLGLVAVDVGLAAEAATLPQVTVDGRAHAAEHSLEVQLPFLQRVLAELTVLPLVVGHAEPAEVSRVIQRFLGREGLVVVISSDLSHYLPYDAATAVDAGTARRIAELAPERISLDEACGAMALNGLLLAARRAGLEPCLLDLRNSGDTAGPHDEVVGYAAVAFVRATHAGATAEGER